jgi:hypothetical protein
MWRFSAESAPRFWNSCPADDPYVTSEWALGADASALQITATFATGHVPSTIDIVAQVENSIGIYSVNAQAGAFASGALSIEVEGAASYSFTSPTFLTVPEPRAAALGFAAFGALAVRRQRGAKPRA